MNMILWKELREGVKTVPVAMLVAAIVAYKNTPDIFTADTTFVPNSIFVAMLVGGLYAFILSLLQTWNEQRTDVRGWLLSQPTNRGSFFWGKFLAAGILYGAALVPVYLVSVVWIYRHFPQDGPIDPRSIFASGIALLAAFWFYPAGVWMMSRPGKWIGTKSLPMAMAFFIVGLTTGILSSRAQIQVLVSAGIVLAIALLTVVAANHSYQRLTNMPQRWFDRASEHRGSRLAGRLSATAVVIGTLIVYLFAVALVSQYVADQFRGPYQPMYHRVVSDDGDLFEVNATDTYVPGKGNVSQIKEVIQVLPGSIGQPIQERQLELSEDNRERFRRLVSSRATLSSFEEVSVTRPMFQNFGYTQLYIPESLFVWYQHSSGVLYGYRQYSNLDPLRETALVTTLDRSGFGSTSDPFSKSGVSVMPQVDGSSNFLGLLVDRDGIYQVNVETSEIRTLLEKKLSGAVLVSRFGDASWTVVVRHDNEVDLYDLAAVNGAEITGAEVTESELTQSEMFGEATDDEVAPAGPLQLVYRETIELPVDWRDWSSEASQVEAPYLASGYIAPESIHSVAEGRVFLKAEHYRFGAHVVELTPANDASRSLSITRYPSTPTGGRDTTIAGIVTSVAVPPLILFGSVVLTVGGIQLVAALIFVVIQSVTACFWTRAVMNRRSLSSTHRRLWGVTAAALGWCVPVVATVLHPTVAKEPCQACGEGSRVDEGVCTHCGKEKFVVRLSEGESGGIVLLDEAETRV